MVVVKRWHGGDGGLEMEMQVLYFFGFFVHRFSGMENIEEEEDDV